MINLPYSNLTSFNTFLKTNLYDYNITCSDISTNKKEILLSIKQFLFFVWNEIHSKNLVFGTSEDGTFYTDNRPNLQRISKFINFYQSNISYTPPECIFKYFFEGQYSDMWIIGCLLYKIIFGKDLFITIDNIENIEKLKKCHLKYKDSSIVSYLLKRKEVSIFFISILNDTLNFNSKNRLLTSTLLQKYFKEKVSLLSLPLSPPVSVELQYFDLNSFLSQEINFYNYVLNTDEKNYIKSNISSFLDNDNLLYFILNENNLFFVKLLIIIKASLLVIFVKSAFIHPIKDILFIKEFLNFKSSYSQEENEENIFFSIGIKIYNFLILKEKCTP